ncbi:MAG: hypothetical protein KGH53_03215 [Candidatus Micrarchaeota archaeon]|nr:hypothetical protein [Candidatus Micrarchaeota archaeon]
MHVVKKAPNLSKSVAEVVMFEVKARFCKEFGTEAIIAKGVTKKGELWFSLNDTVPSGDLNAGMSVSKSEIQKLQFHNPGFYRETLSITQDGPDIHAYTTKEISKELREKLRGYVHEMLKERGLSDKQITNFLVDSV